MPQRVQDPHAKRDQTDEEDIGEHQAVEQYRQFKLSRNGLESGKHDTHDPGRKEDANQCNGGHYNCQQGTADIGQIAGLFLPALGQGGGKGGDKRRSKGPFGKKAAQHVGDLECGKKGIGRQTGAEQARDDHIPYHPHNARKHGGTAKHSGCPGDIPFLGHQRPSSSGHTSVSSRAVASVPGISCTPFSFLSMARVRTVA